MFVDATTVRARRRIRFTGRLAKHFIMESAKIFEKWNSSDRSYPYLALIVL